MSEEKIKTRHPDPLKNGVNISKLKYDQVRDAIVQTLQEQQSMTFVELGNAVAAKLEGQFKGSIGWYYTTVKLDLEARGVLERVGMSSPQRLRLIEGSSEGKES